jgi:mannose-6-phosphate isomerase-like protein (cupin superfamily)
MITHYFSSGLYTKETKIPAQHVLVQHSHKHDHFSILAQGSVELMVDGVKTIIHAPACLTIEAGKHHGIKSLTEVVWYCIHATEYTDTDDIDLVLAQPIDTDVVNLITQTLVKEA